MANSNPIIIDQKITKVALFKEADTIDVSERITVTDVKLPSDAPARMKTLRAENKKWYLTIVFRDYEAKQPFALFCQTNSLEKSAQTSDALDRLLALARTKGILAEHIESTATKCANASNTSKLTRAISLLLRHGVLIKNIVAELDNMDDVVIGSFLFQIKKFLSQYIQDGEVVETETCTTCGGTLVFSEGCMMCRDCGNSKCG